MQVVSEWRDDAFDLIGSQVASLWADTNKKSKIIIIIRRSAVILEIAFFTMCSSSFALHMNWFPASAEADWLHGETVLGISTLKAATFRKLEVTPYLVDVVKELFIYCMLKPHFCMELCVFVESV